MMVGMMMIIDIIRIMMMITVIDDDRGNSTVRKDLVRFGNYNVGVKCLSKP